METEEIKILLVDDEEKIISRLGRILAGEGYRVDSAPNGNNAIEKINQGEFDIVITDLKMPGKDGFEVMEHIKGRNLDILLLVLTGYASVEGAIQAIKLGAYDFIQKPIDVETLKLSIKRAAERVRLKRENVRNMNELKKLNELKDEFLTVVSHDLRSPLSSIGGYINYLLRKGDLNDLQRSYLQITRDISNDLYALVNELLDISKIESGVIRLNEEDVDIADLINASINNFLLLSYDKNNKLEFQNLLRDPHIRIDRMKILQVINNFVNNAVKFTENGSITVASYEDGDDLFIAVEDTGVGIPVEEIDNIFEKYSYYHQKGTRGEAGTGFGLAICKRFVELHGGTIRVTSSVGQGSKFEFNIPRGKKSDA